MYTSEDRVNELQKTWSIFSTSVFPVSQNATWLLFWGMSCATGILLCSSTSAVESQRYLFLKAGRTLGSFPWPV